MNTDIVRVYRNLHRNCFSVQTKSEGRWRVSQHTNDLTLEDVSFRVYEKARQRVIKTKNKSPHAYLTGSVSKIDIPDTDLIRVRYNPYVRGDFFSEDGRAIRTAKFAKLTNVGVFVLDGDFVSE